MRLEKFFMRKDVGKIQSRTVLDAVKHYERNTVTLHRSFDRYVDALVSSGSAETMWKTFYDDDIRCGSDACLLCKKYVHCANCPVGKAGHLHCNNTPWNNVSNLIYSGKDMESKDDAVRYLNEVLDAFGREIVFLLSLV